MTDITAKLAEALREAEDALDGCYEVADYPANGTSRQDKALASVRAALTAYTASQSTPGEETVERVAKAIDDAINAGPSRETWSAKDGEMEISDRLARAAIAAMLAQEVKP